MGKTVRGAVVLAWVALLIPACKSTSPDGTGTPPPAPPVGLNQPPTVRLLTPLPNTLLQNGTAVDLEAAANDPDGGIVSVAFFEGRPFSTPF
jgi:hypothetical protein